MMAPEVLWDMVTIRFSLFPIVPPQCLVSSWSFPASIVTSSVIPLLTSGDDAIVHVFQCNCQWLDYWLITNIRRSQCQGQGYTNLARSAETLSEWQTKQWYVADAARHNREPAKKRLNNHCSSTSPLVMASMTTDNTASNMKPGKYSENFWTYIHKRKVISIVQLLAINRG